jgi:hypothetical protein
MTHASADHVIGRSAALLLVGTVVGGITLGCRGATTAPPVPPGAVFQVRVCEGSSPHPLGEVFRILLQDSTRIGEATILLSSGKVGIVAGTLLSGDGDFNSPWSWRLAPSTISFPDVTIEACQGCPSDVQDNLSHWLQMGEYCAYPAQISARDR